MSKYDMHTLVYINKLGKWRLDEISSDPWIDEKWLSTKLVGNSMLDDKYVVFKLGRRWICVNVDIGYNPYTKLKLEIRVFKTRDEAIMYAMSMLCQ